MLRTALARLASAADLLRPRTFFRTLARVDQLADATRELTAAVEALRVRTEQLAAIERLNCERQDDVRRLDVLLDRDRIFAHIRDAVEAAPLSLDPCPHIVVDGWLPDDTYRIMVDGLPPAIFFADREERRQRLLVPFSFAPDYHRRVWRFIAEDVVGCALSEALNRKFRDVVRDYVGTFCRPYLAEPWQPLHPSDGRIMLRRPGYVIEPHRDPKWGFVTGLVYLAREGDNETYGTQFYRVSDDAEAPNDKPLWLDPRRCELVKSVPFRANTLVAFLNSRGAHGASIPADAEPATLERYVYQFRLGPDASTMRRMLSLMTPQQQALWVGVKMRKASLPAPAATQLPDGVSPVRSASDDGRPLAGVG